MESGTQGPAKRRAAGEHGFGRRVLGAIALDREIFREVERDPAALWQAALVTVAGGLAQTAGTAGLWPVDDGSLTAGDLAASIGGSLLVWLVSTAAVWLVGAKLMRARAELAALLRAVGFSAAPQLLYLACPALAASHGVPGATWTVAAAAWVLTQAAWFVSAQQALGVGSLRALAIFSIAGFATALLGLALLPLLPGSLWRALVL